MRVLISLGAIALFLAGCGQDPVGLDVRVQEGAVNQTAIVVTNAHGRNPDYVLFELQGYEQARKNFFQLDMTRRVSRGRLAEIFGPAALEQKGKVLTDVNVWAVGLVRAQDLTLAKLQARHPEVLALLQAYSDGVNRFLREADVTQPELIERYRRITKNRDYRPDAWQPIDSIAIATQMAFLLSQSLDKKLVLGTMVSAAMASPEADPIHKLLDLRPLENISILPKKKADPSRPRPRGLNLWDYITMGAAGQYSYQCPDSNSPFGAGRCGKFGSPGSNNWVVSAKYAGGDVSFLANDPHLNFAMPGTFDEVTLNSKPAGGSFHVQGLVPKGFPGVLIGRNEKIAWGLTNNVGDGNDLYLELIRPKRGDPTREVVIFKGKEVELIHEPHDFYVRNEAGGLDKVTKVLRRVPHHGPIVSDHVPEIQTVQSNSPREAISYKWTGHEGTTEAVAIFHLNRAGNYQEFREALQYFQAGAQNIVYADLEGNIGYYSHADFPMRPFTKENIAPFIPLVGSGSREWDGYRQEVPELYNPPAGYIVTANNDPYGYNQEPNLSGFHDYFGFAWDPGSRAKRISYLIEKFKREKGRITAKDMMAIQMDQSDQAACRYIALLAAAKPNLRLGAEATAFAEKLIQWRGADPENGCVASATGEEALLYTIWLAELLKGYYGWLKTAIDAKFSDWPESSRQRIFSDFVGSAFGLQTVYHRTREALETADVRKFLTEATEAAVKTMDRRRLVGVRWGAVHQLEFGNLLAGFMPSLPFPRLERGGTWTTVDMGAFELGSLFHEGDGELRLPNEWGPNFRLVIALEKGKGMRAYNVLPGGPGSSLALPGALQELLDWRDGRYRDFVQF